MNFFNGIKTLEIEKKTDEISGFETFLQEKLFFKIPLKFQGFSSDNLLSELEISSKSIIKSRILKSFPLIIKTNGDHIALFKLLTSKTTIFQALLLINDLLFFHELTVILKKSEKNEINTEKSLLKFIEKIYISLKNFIDYFRKNLAQNVMKSFYMAFSQFTLQIIKHVNILEDFLDKKVMEISCFEYLSLPKLTFDLHKTRVSCDISDVISRTCDKNNNEKYHRNNANFDVYSHADSEFLLVFLKNEENPGLDISMISFNYKVNYGYEPVNYTGNQFIYTKMSEKFMFDLASTFVNHSGLYIKGAVHSGKKQTFKVNYSRNFIFSRNFQ